MQQFNRIEGQRQSNSCSPRGPKKPLKPSEVWSIRARLQLENKVRDLAMFNLAIDSKLRACDLVAIQVGDVVATGQVKRRSTIRQRKTHNAVQFEISQNTGASIRCWIKVRKLDRPDYLFPSRVNHRSHISVRQYARIVRRWISSAGLNPNEYGTHSLRRTKAAEIYRATGNLRAVQILLGHRKIETTVRYLGVDVEDALSISESLDL